MANDATGIRTEERESSFLNHDDAVKIQNNIISMFAENLRLVSRSDVTGQDVS